MYAYIHTYIHTFTYMLDTIGGIKRTPQPFTMPYQTVVNSAVQLA